MGSFTKIKMWLFGSEAKARAVAERHLANASIGLPTGLEGDAQDDVDGMISGGVIWPVKAGTHGAKAFLTSQKFLAFYDGKKREAYMLDDLDGTRHPGAEPLKVGRDLKVAGNQKRSGLGHVCRTAEIGEAGLYKNVFTFLKSDLISHHQQPSPPDNSSMVADPDDASERQGGLHYLTRVVKVVAKFCSGGKYKADDKPLYAPVLNYGRNGDGTDAYGLAHFDRGIAALSDEAKGFTAVADDGNHRIFTTDEATGHQGGINIVEALFGDTKSGIIYSPADFNPAQIPPRARGPLKMFVEWREDYLDSHFNYCGKKVPGRKKWYAESVIGEFDPGSKRSDDPAAKGPDDPATKKPTDNSDPVPKCILPPETGIPPTAGTPYELESPSQYGHPMPSVPDGQPPEQGQPSRYKDRDGTGEDVDDGGYGVIEQGRRVANDLERRLARARQDIARRRAARAAVVAERAAAAERDRASRENRPDVQNDLERRIAEARAEIERRNAEREARRAANKVARERPRRDPEADRAARRAHGAASEAKWRAKRAQSNFWLNRFGFTEEEWQRQPVTAHRFVLPEYQFSTAREGGERWPTVKDTHELLTFHPDGSVDQRVPATGPGKVIEAPAWTRPWHAFKALFGSVWRESQHVFMVLAGRSGSTTIDGKMGMGVAAPGVRDIVSGWQAQLDHSDSSATPNAEFTMRGADGAQTTDSRFIFRAIVQANADAKVPALGNPNSGDYATSTFWARDDGGGDVTPMFGEVELGAGGGTGDVVGPSSATDNAIARFDTTTGKLIQNSGVVIDDASGSTIRVHTGAAAHILITPDGSLSSGTFNTTVDAGGTGSTTLNLGTTAANAVAIGRSGKTTTFAGLAYLSGQQRLSINTPSQITSNQTGYTGFNTGIVQRASTDASRTLNTILAPTVAAGGFILVINIGSYDLVFKNDDGVTGTAADRIVTGLGTDYTLSPLATAMLMYDTTSSRWRILV